MFNHKINIQINKNGLWTISEIDSQTLYAFIHFYNTVYSYQQRQNDETHNANYINSIIIDNQTGTVIQNPFE